MARGRLKPPADAPRQLRKAKADGNEEFKLPDYLQELLLESQEWQNFGQEDNLLVQVVGSDSGKDVADGAAGGAPPAHPQESKDAAGATAQPSGSAHGAHRGDLSHRGSVDKHADGKGGSEHTACKRQAWLPEFMPQHYSSDLLWQHPPVMVCASQFRWECSGPDEPSHSAVEPGLPALLPSDEADASGDDCSAAGACLATCSACGSTHCVGFDVAELGIDFQCGLAGMECAGSPTPAGQPTGAPLPAADERAGSESLSAEERNELFKRFALQSEVKGSLAHNVQHLVGRSEMPKVRYRDNQVVTHKGERFIRQDRNPSIAAGCSIGGVLGARKLGRQGLGLKKRPKEEVDRVCISNKERAHTKKDAGHKDVYVFDSKWQHRTR